MPTSSSDGRALPSACAMRLERPSRAALTSASSSVAISVPEAFCLPWAELTFATSAQTSPWLDSYWPAARTFALASCSTASNFPCVPTPSRSPVQRPCSTQNASTGTVLRAATTKS